MLDQSDALGGAGRVLDRLVEAERLVDDLKGLAGGRAIDQDADLDLAGRDHLDVDPGLGEGLEHLLRDAGVGPHPQADDRHLGHLGLVRQPGGADGPAGLLGDEQGLFEVGLVDGEADLGHAVGGDVLDDHVDDDVGRGDRAEDPPDDAGAVGHADQRDPRLVLGQGRAGDADPQPPGVPLGDDPRPLVVLERTPDVDRHAVLLGELDRPRVHHPGAQARQFEHLVEADPVDLAGLGHDPGVGGVDAVDVGVDLAGVRPEDGRQRDGGGVGPAPAEGGDVVVVVDPLEAGDDDDLALVERLADPLGRDVPDPGLGVEAVGDDPDLGAGEADRGDAQGVDRHRHQGDADLLAGRQEHVHLAGRGALVDLLGQLDQLVGGVPRAETTTRTFSPRLCAAIARRAAARIFVESATLVPPNFCTKRAKGFAPNLQRRDRTPAGDEVGIEDRGGSNVEERAISSWPRA